MPKVDVVIKGGIVYTPRGPLRAGIAVDEGAIVAIGQEGSLPQAERAINAEGKVVIPGFIDTHVHTRDPGYTYKEDFETATKAAAAGGVTMIVDMPNVHPPPSTLERFEERRRNAKGKAVVDFNHWSLPSNQAEVPKIAEAGGAGYKFFMKAEVKEGKPVYPYLPENSLTDHGDILRAFTAVAKTGLPQLVHPLDPDIWSLAEQEIYYEAGRRDVEAYFDCYSYADCSTLNLAVSMLVLLAKATGVRLRILHVNWRPMQDLVRQLKAAGYRFIAEFNPWAAFTCREENRKIGPFGFGVTPEAEMEESWKSLLDGTIDVIATDHAPHTREELEPGRQDFFKTPKGVPGVQEYMPLFLTEVNRGRISMQRLIELCSENAAKHIGVYPRKGAITVGSDADLVVVDLRKKDVIRAEKMYSKCGWTVWEGREVLGVPTLTMVRGGVVMEDGQITVKAGYGDFVKAGHSAIL